jgi:hypothetical protein
MAAFGHIAKGPVRRYDLPNLRALNFLIDNVSGGGVTPSPCQDRHGKILSFFDADHPVAGIQRGGAASQGFAFARRHAQGRQPMTEVMR